jgi:hypothetical protein
MPRHIAPADRLRVVHGGRDQVVDIDVFELEHLEHMGAARVQKLRDLRLIPGAVELRLHGVRCRPHLAQCEGGGKYLDEN